MLTALAPNLTVLVRGWLHGNVVLASGDAPALIDAGYHTGVDDVLALATLADRPLADLLLTHAHSDHGGGVRAVVEATGARVAASRGTAALVAAWDEAGLWLGASGQEMPRFHVDATLDHGDAVVAGGRTWQVIGAPGHMRSAVALFDAEDGVLVTGDALWEHGFGMLDPWVEGPDCFDLAALALDRLAAVGPARVVVPGHGAPFSDLAGALARARARLARLAADPDAIRRMVALGGVGFLRMARPELTLDALSAIVLATLEAHPPRAASAPPPAALLRDALAALGLAGG